MSENHRGDFFDSHCIVVDLAGSLALGPFQPPGGLTVRLSLGWKMLKLAHTHSVILAMQRKKLLSV